MRTTKIERVRGVNDILPEECAIATQIENTLRDCFASFGYRPIDVPLIEYTELYLRKSGEEIAARLYDFIYRNRRLCLRPELTASVVRAYIDHLQGLPLPVRLYYVGSAFRYERPQKERYRQFTQMGIELIGVTGGMADAEVISTACQGLNALGLTGYRLYLGHISVVSKFLDSLQIETRLRSFLLTQMEVLRKDGKAEVERRLCDIYPAFELYTANRELSQERLADESRRIQRLTTLFQDMEESEARESILDLLASMNVELGGNRDAQEIVDRLLGKMQRQDQTARISKALEFMRELGQLVGEPAAVFQEAEKLLSVYGIDYAGLDRLREIINTLEFYHLDQSQIILDLGMSRGLQYYTGMIFEIHHGSGGETRQVCGGGRYDDLVATFGGRQDTPATGFSYGMERLQVALEADGKLGKSRGFVEVLVVPVSQEDAGYAIGVAQELRQAGLRVEMDVKNKSVSSNFEYANKQGIPFAIAIGPDERRTGEIVLKNMASGEQQRMKVSEVASQFDQRI
ncbi:MAG TPA: ATP phosphoribosyltransferase regulatory subunit [Cyanobacteria bacterium UBA11149]|nr:ATP phosphoribosyltransferase regulatory subunit [Cyanobacteria bacterium UBA11367]HBE58102.1 ATP phosphoribosyltransferase regulatory subunit [Cyanobacteria bacterium UBA11366]HBK65361.1 ATP phosphoribosyltransferase regulatory subunit [Cyanobacteria bacterium UBA11166]HBR76679.1 ATP phosphoribosyltransferase regulatory subunit [Cyanobacteria bacterium UBA11159]HBS68056.1 ATP phosphoribosyltransferase regulatory subunit [Cyanobacteria bacterium UBA11153]HBW88756.1 ATP phosphoribosyltransfe